MRGGIRARMVLPPTGETEQLKHSETPLHTYTDTHICTHIFDVQYTTINRPKARVEDDLTCDGTFQLSALLRIKDKDGPFKYNPTAVKHFECSTFVFICYVLLRNCP